MKKNVKENPFLNFAELDRRLNMKGGERIYNTECVLAYRLYHRASLESAPVSWMHGICCDNMNTKKGIKFTRFVLFSN